MNRRQIEHVEAHLGHIGQPSFTIFQSTVQIGFHGAGTRKHLVPSAECGFLSLYCHQERGGKTDRKSTIGILEHQLRELLRPGDIRLLVSLRRVGQRCRPRLQQLLGLRGSRINRRADKLGADHQIRGHVLAGFDPLLKVPLPRREVIDPRLHRVLASPQHRDLKSSLPPVVPRRAHGNLLPARTPQGTKLDYRSENVVTVGEHPGPHHDALANYPFDWKTTAIHLGRQGFNRHPLPATSTVAFLGRRNSTAHRLSDWHSLIDLVTVNHRTASTSCQVLGG